MYSKVRSRAPLRLGLGGGGTDVSPYSETYGGNVLNATINLFARCTIKTDSKKLIFEASDLNESITSKAEEQILDGKLILHKAVYNRIMKDFNKNKFIPLKVTTSCDAPLGSGLGSSSTIVVAMIKAYQLILGLPLGDYDIANLAYEIERNECKLLGGKQDQYSAAFGGINFIDFKKNNQVIVNPLRINSDMIAELEENMVLFFTGKSRRSEDIISHQIKSSQSKKRLSGMHKIKQTAILMKKALLEADIEKFISIQKDAWEAKKMTSKKMSSYEIDLIADTLISLGAKAIKLSGAGGGGFMIIYCDPSIKNFIKQELNKHNGEIFSFNFSLIGAEAWRV